MGMMIDGVACSEHIDSSGEVLKVKNHDISDLEEGRASVNWEHQNNSPEDIIGAVTYAKKILIEDDATTDRQKMYWNLCKKPFVYIKAELMDGDLHPGAVAAAAIIRYYHRKKEKILAGFSIEGSTLEREDNVLTRTVGRRLALTLRPCNKSCISGVLEDPTVDDSIKKFITSDSPINTNLFEVDSCIISDMEKSESDPITELKKSLDALQKTLTAGGYGVAPGQLTGGAALSVEDRTSKKIKDRLKTAIAAWDKKRPIREAIKAALPEVSDDYVDHFTSLAEDLSLKKGDKPLVRVDPHHSWNKNANDDQKKLITGLYVDPSAKFGHDMTNQPRHKMLKLRNDSGNHVLVKFPNEDTGHEQAMNATDYYHMANNFFGLGEHVPVTNHFDHEGVHKGHKSMQAQEFKEGAITPWVPEFDKIMQKSRENGSAHKLALMDMITNGDSDRHYGNIMAHKDKLIHIDNDDAFQYNDPILTPPSHYNDFDDDKGIGNDTVHIDASRWLQDLDPKKMVKQMKQLGMDNKQSTEAARRLLTLKELSKQSKNFYKMRHIINGGKEE